MLALGNDLNAFEIASSRIQKKRNYYMTLYTCVNIGFELPDSGGNPRI